MSHRLKELRLLGMVGAWTDLLTQWESQIGASKWLIEHLLQAEHTDRAMRSISHQMKIAWLPIHRDLAWFDFACESAAPIDESQIDKRARREFVETTQRSPRTRASEWTSVRGILLRAAPVAPFPLQLLQAKTRTRGIRKQGSEYT